MVRRRGGDPFRPYKIRRSGLVWRVFGRAIQRPYHIQLLIQGRYRNLLAYRRNDLGRQLIDLITRMELGNLIRFTPVLYGPLRQSTKYLRNPIRIRQGPRRGRFGGKYYGRIANQRSKRNAGFIERSITVTSRRSIRTINKFERLRSNLERIPQIAGSRRLFKT